MTLGEGAFSHQRSTPVVQDEPASGHPPLLPRLQTSEFLKEVSPFLPNPRHHQDYDRSIFLPQASIGQRIWQDGVLHFKKTETDQFRSLLIQDNEDRPALLAFLLNQVNTNRPTCDPECSYSVVARGLMLTPKKS